MKPAAPPLQPFTFQGRQWEGEPAPTRHERSRSLFPEGDISMKAVVFHGLGDIRLETVPEPKIEKPTDAIVRLTASAICGTDLHMVRGTMPGHGARHDPRARGRRRGRGGRRRASATSRSGDRVVVPSTICCGHCSYCTSRLPRRSATTPTRTASRPGPRSSAGRATTGPINGLQAEFARVPLADPTLDQAPGRDERRPGDPAVGHLPDRLFRGRRGRDQAGRHGRGVRLRAGRAVRDRQRQAARRRPGVRRRHAARSAGQGPRARGGDDRLQRRAAPSRGSRS